MKGKDVGRVVKKAEVVESEQVEALKREPLLVYMTDFKPEG